MKCLSMILCVLGAMLLVGCSSTKEHAFDISVKNDSGGPVTIWLTKDGRPAEKGWRSPEQVAMQAPGHEERIGGVLVPDGKTASTGPIKGKFEPGCFAWLRVYDGKYASFSDLLAVSPRSVRRVDQPLDPGKNALIVKRRGTRLVVEPDESAAGAADAAKATEQLR
jgi:hypothetical protein